MLNFGDVLKALKRGERVRRDGWNGKGMFLFLVAGGEMEHPALHDKVEALPYIAMSTVQGAVVPWLASQTDMLAEDWLLVAP